MKIWDDKRKGFAGEKKPKRKATMRTKKIANSNRTKQQQTINNKQQQTTNKKQTANKQQTTTNNKQQTAKQHQNNSHRTHVETTPGESYSSKGCGTGSVLASGSCSPHSTARTRLTPRPRRSSVKRSSSCVVPGQQDVVTCDGGL